MTVAPLLMAGCGILGAEVLHLVRKNQWPIEARFLDSALHADPARLRRELGEMLQRESGRRVVVFYGACHPRMDAMLEDAGIRRIAGQNCVEALLGHEAFERELAAGAYFLLEEWARRWEEIVRRTFGPDPDVAREIFRSDRSYILAVRTPCSSDFGAEAGAAARRVGLPLRWMDVSLDHLESVLAAAIAGERAHP